MRRTVLRPHVATRPYVRSTTALTAARGLGLGAAAVLFLATGVLLATQAGGWSAVFGVLLLLLVLLGVGLTVGMLAHPRRGRLEVGTAEGRLWLPALRWWQPVVVASVLLVLALLAVPVLRLLDGVGAPGWTSVGAVLAAVALFPVLAATLRGQSVAPRLGLGPDGVLRESGRTAQVVRWDDVDSVDLVADPAPRVLVHARCAVPTRYRSRPTAGERPVGGPPTRPDQLPIATNLHGSDPRLVELLLRHYLRHPAHRQELGTPAAVDRILRGDLSG